MATQSVPFFDGFTPWIDAAHYTADGMLRSSRHGSMPGVVADMDQFVGLTVHANDGFIIRRTKGIHGFDDTAAPGRAFLDGPGERLHIKVDGSCRVLQFRMPIATVEQILLEDHDNARGFAAFQTLQGEQDPSLLGLMGRALIAASDEERDVRIRGVFARLLVAHGAATTTLHRRGLPPSRLRRVRELVTAQSSTVTLRSMADAAGLSVYHFSREFRHETGQTPWEFVLHHRVWEAARLISAGECSMTEVAERTGFSDRSHMTRTFRNLLGLTPGTIRARLMP